MTKHLKTFTAVIAVIGTLSGIGVFKAVVWAGDKHWVTISSLTEYFDKKELSQTEEEINKLNTKKEIQGLTPLEKAELKRLENKRDTQLKR